MTSLRRFTRGAALLVMGLAALVFCRSSSAEVTAPGLIQDINSHPVGSPFLSGDGPNFAPGSYVFASTLGSTYTADTGATLPGNDVLAITQSGLSGLDGAGFVVSVSNGENGDGQSPNLGGAMGADPSNPFPPDPAFAAIGNSSGRLEDGNVIRFSTWVRLDPDLPLTVEPQIAPIVKLEFWRDAFSSEADTAGGQENPDFGGRIFDTDQNRTAIPDPDQQARLLDVDGDGQWGSFGPANEPALSSDAWQQIVHTYTVDSAGQGWDIGDSAAVEDVSFVEEIRGVVFLGDFSLMNLGGPGTILWDNALIEVFADEAAEAVSDVMVSNPRPVPEPTTLLLGAAGLLLTLSRGERHARAGRLAR